MSQLAEFAGERKPVTRTFDGLGRYRVVGANTRRPGEKLVVGLSLSHVEQTLVRVALIFAVVTAAAWRLRQPPVFSSSDEPWPR